MGYSPQDCKESETTAKLSTRMRLPSVSSSGRKQTKRNRQKRGWAGVVLSLLIRALIPLMTVPSS